MFDGRDPTSKWSWPIVSVAILVAGTLACQVLASGSPPTPRPEIETAFSAFAGPDDQIDRSFDDLQTLMLEHPEETEQAALQYIDSDIPNMRFAAAYALVETASSEQGVEALHMLLDDPDLKVLAAEGLLIRGEKAGLPVLIEALGSQEGLPYSEPPVRAWQYARDLLTLYTDEDFGLRKAQNFETASATREAWLAWWGDGEAIEWDAEALVFMGVEP